MTRQACYEPSELAAASLGRLPDSRAEEIFRHADQCARCEKILADQETRASTSDPLFDAVSEMQGNDTASLPQQIDDYLIERRLGQGGLGVVFLARHRLLSNRCVIKVVQNRYEHHTDIQQRFLREMKVLSGLQHENIVQVLSAGMWRDQPYLVMEYLEGEDLEQRVGRDGPLPLQDACRLIADAADALQHAHDVQVTHRDIKPSNLFVTKDDETKVIDFGLARMLESAEADLPNMSTREGAIPGTPQFMSPEQFRSSKVDALSDIYSLGAAFVYLLTGQPPVLGNAMELMRYHSDPEPAEPVPELKRYPSQIRLLIRKMLARDVSRRPASMNEVAVALRTFLDQTHSDSEFTSAPMEPASTARPSRRRILMLSAFSLLTPLACIVAFGWPVQLNSNDSDRKTANDNAAIAKDTKPETKHPSVVTAMRAIEQFEIPENLKQAVTGSILQRNDATELVDDSQGVLYSLRVVPLPKGPNGKRLWPAIFAREETKATARLLKIESIRERAQQVGLTDTSGLDEAIEIAAADPRFVGTVKHLSSHQGAVENSTVVLVHAPQKQIDATLQSELAMERLREAYRDAIHRQSRRLMQQERWAESLELWRHLHQLELTTPKLYLDAANCFVALEQEDDAVGLLQQTLKTHSDQEDWLFFQDVGELLIGINTPEAQTAAVEAFDLAAEKYTVLKK